jgi:protoporphyrinogen oxidase
VFAVVGAGIMALSLYRFLRRRRYGTTTFEMETFPGALGGILCGTLHTDVPLHDPPPDGFRVKLSCY